jgi:Type IV pili methyl-accepting chemotaxis transducer N-term
MNRRPFLACSVALSYSLFALPFAPAFGQASSLSSAINRTARCRMLSQRAVKGYALVAFKLNSDNAKPVLLKSIKEMRDALTEVGTYNRGRSFANSRAEFSAQVLPFLNELANEPNLVKFASLSALSDKVLDSANAMVMVLESEAGTSTGKIINIAGRQRMLTQRLAKNYLLNEAKLDVASLKTGMENDRTLFLDSLKQLGMAPVMNEQIKDSLEKSRALFMGYSGALAQANNIESIARISETILLELDNQTSLFEKAAG